MRLYLPLLLLLLSSCSSISTGYTVHAQGDFIMREICATGPDESVPCARISFEGMSIIFWAATPVHPTMRGPCLFPLVPEEQPILDSYDLHLHMRILRSSGAHPDIKLLSESLTAAADGRTEKPAGVTEYSFNDGVDSILEYYSADEPLPAAFMIDGGRTFDLWLPGIVYAKTKAFEIEPVFLVQGVRKKGPRVRFEPAFRRDYTPYYFPFMYPPVR